MKRFLLGACALLVTLSTAFAVDPGGQPTGLILTPAATSITATFTASVVAPPAFGYLVVRNVGSYSSATPVDGTNYAVGNTLGTGLIVYKNTTAGFTDSSLPSGTNFYYSVYAFTGTLIAPDFLITSPLENTAATTGAVTQPGAQPTALSFSAITATSFVVTFTVAANNPGYLAVRNAGSAPIGAPVDGTTYSVGDNLGNGVVAFVGSGRSFSQSGLSQQTTYGYAIYSFNGDGGTIDYRPTSPLNTPTTATTGAVELPGAQPTALTFTNVTSSGFTVSFTAAAGVASYLAVRDVGSAPSTFPVDGAVYSVGNTLGTGVVAYVGSATSFAETLPAGTTFGYSIYSFNGTIASTDYLTGSTPLNTPTQATGGAVAEPGAQPTGLAYNTVTGTSFNVTFTAASGAARYIAVRNVAVAPTGAPVDGTGYSVGDNLGNGIVAFVGSGTAFSESGLFNETTYAYAIYSFNGDGATSNYLTTSPLSTPTQATTGTSDQPGAQPTGLGYSNVTSSGFTVSFTASASAAAYIAVRDVGSAPSTAPVNGATYTVGATLGTGVVAYVGSATSFVETLPAGTTFGYSIYSFNGSGANTEYLTPSPLNTPTQATGGAVAEPGAQPTGLAYNTVTGTAFNVTFTAASGAARYIAVRNVAVAPTGAPVDGTGYSVGDNLGNGIVAFVGSGTAFAQTSLLNQTTYAYAIYSFNGDGATSNYLTSSPLNSPTQATTGTVDAPGAGPTSLTYTGVSSSGFTVSFTAAATTAAYIAVRDVGSAPPTAPSDGSSYTVGASLGTGVVAYVGSATSFIEAALSAGTTYGYSIYSFNGSGANTDYLTASPLNTPTQATTGAVVEPGAQPTGLSYNTVATTSFNVTFTAAAGAAGYIAIRNAGSAPIGTPVDGTAYSVGSNLGNGVVAFVGSGTAFAQTGLSQLTTYGYAVYAFNGNGGSINYLTASPLNTPTQATTGTVAQPAAQPTGLGYSSVSSSGFTVSFTASAATAGYIAIRDVGTAPAAPPVDGSTYTVGNPFGTGVIAFIGSATSFVETGLSAGTTYGYSIYSFNGSGAGINYRTASPLNTPTQATSGAVAAPGAQPTSLVYSAVTTTGYNVSYTAASGAAGYIVIRAATAAPSLPPSNGTFYTVGNTIGTGTVAFVGSGTSYIQSGLAAGTLFFSDIYAFNGNGAGVVYNLVAPLSGSQATAPSTQATAITFSAITTSSMTVGWTNGNGARRIVVAKQAGAITGVPINNTPYTFSSNWNFGAPAATDLGAGNFVVYDGTGNSFPITNLSPNTSYSFKVFEYGGSGTANANYGLPLVGANNPLSKLTIVNTVPGAQATGINFIGTGLVSTLQLGWTDGTSTGGRVVLIKQGTDFLAGDLPVNGTSYTNSTLLFPAGTLIGAARAVYFQATPGAGVVAGPITIDGLTANTLYFVKVFEFDGTSGTGNESYLTTGPSSSRSTVSGTEPSTSAGPIVFGVATANSVPLTWTDGNGTGGRLVLAKPVGTFVAADFPIDGDTYSYAGLNYAFGTPVGPNGSRVVYYETGDGATGTGSGGITVVGLTAATFYKFAVVEFNGTTNGAENYDTTGTTNNPRTIQTTAGAPPGTQANTLTFTTTATSNSLNLNWTHGNGNGGRIVVANTVPITVADNPMAGVSYNSFNQDFTLAQPIGSGSAFVVYREATTGGTTSGIPISGLNPSTTYYFKVYEFNGVAGSSTENYNLTDVGTNPNSATTNVQPTATYAVTSGTLGNAGIATDFTITFNTAMQLASNAAIATDADIKTFVHLEDATTNAPITFTSSIVGNVITIIPSNSNIAGNNLTGSRDYNLFIDNNEIETTVAEVPLPTSTQPIVATTLIEPANPPTLPTSVATLTDVTVGWTDAVAGLQAPENYLIVGIENGGSFPAVADLTDPAVDLDFSDGTVIAKVAHGGVQTLNLTTGVKSGQPYDFQIYSYTNESGAINFLLLPLVTTSVTTAIGAQTVVENGAGSAVVSSITNNLAAATAAGANFTFDVNDDGAPINNGADNAPTRITQIVINRDLVNDQTVNWTTLLGTTGGVLLTDGANPINSFATPAAFTIAADQITIDITSVPALGLVADNTTKTFQVKLWLRTDTAPLNIDAKNMAFTVSDADITVALVNSSNFAGTGTVSRIATIGVVATNLAYVQNATNTSINTAMAPAVTVRANDINGNRDFGYTGNIAITSTGTLTGTPVNIAAVSGISTFSTLTHTATGTGFALTANAGLPGGTVASAIFKITASDIIAKAGYVYPTDINYVLFQDAAPITLGGSIEVGAFTLRDGFINGPDGDLLGTTITSVTLGITNPSYIKSIALYTAADVKLSEQPGAASVIFPALGIAAIDGGVTDFKIRVSFNNIVVDNQNILFSITAVSGTGSSFINGSAGGATTSPAPADNKIEVIASNYQFTSAPPASIFANIAFAPSLTLEARNIHSIIDADYNLTATISNAGSLPMTDAIGHTSAVTFTQAFSGGVLALNNQLRYDIGGLPANGTLTIANLPAGITLTSSPIAVNVSTGSNIVEDFTAFSYPTNIDYLPRQASNINPTASPGDEIKLAQFRIEDGGNIGGTDPDGTDTELTNITFTLTNASFIKQLALYNGAAELGEVTVAGSTATFGPFSASALDEGSLVLSLWASFNTTITDNQKVSFTVSSATANPVKSRFFNGTAGSAFTDLTGIMNQLEVVATKITYTSVAPTAFISAAFPVSVEARDVNNNLDLDNNEAVTISNAGGLSTVPTPATIGPFSGGLLSFSFAYTTPGNGTLTMTTASIPSAQTSIGITVTASAQSTLALNGVYSPRIPYIVSQQNPLPNTADANTYTLGTFVLTDGDAATGDSDNAPTVLQSFVITLSNPTYIKRIALYDALGNRIGADQPGGSSPITFSGLNITALDNTNPAVNSTTFTVRASFESSAVVDETNIQMLVTTATETVGSNFAPGVGGVPLGPLRQTPAVGANMINVVATALVYTQQPLSPAGTKQRVPVTGPEVRLEARDVNGRLDTEFDASSTVSFSAPASVSPFFHPFLNGEAIINRDNLRYLTEGVGTLTAAMSAAPAPGVTTVSNAVSTLVNVFEVKTQIALGFLTPTNLAGGSVDKVIYGITFRTSHAPSGNPILRKFKISFNTTATTDLTTIIENARVFEQVNQVNFVGGAQLGPGSVIIDPGTVHTVSVDLTDAPRDFSLSVNRTYTYFLMVDIKPTANSLTPTIEPYVEDLNWDNTIPGFHPTNANIEVSPLNGANQGGGRSDKLATTGQKYSFAAIFPPKLVSSNPAKGAINVNPGGDIVLTFDVPVWSLDRVIKLWRAPSPGAVGAAGTFITTLPLKNLPQGVLNPAFNTPTVALDPANLANLSNVLTFGPLPNLPTLSYSDLLYITVEPIDLAQTKGIRDQAGNKFAGISSPGTVYFRIASNQPPLLVSGPTPAIPLVSSITNISLSGATIQTTFDSPGTAYYVLTLAGVTPKPTRAQILGAGNNAGGITGVAYLPSITRGSFPINQIQPVGQYGLISQTLVDGTNYDVWVFAVNNDLPTPIPTIGAYGPGPSFAAIADATSATPATFTFTASNPGVAGIIVQAPDLSICAGTSQPLTNPIRIVERLNNDLLGSGAGVQSINLILSTRYQFDISKLGTVQLSATGDFVAASGITEFLSSSVVQVRWTNTGTSGSRDDISISGLYITPTSVSGSGDISKLGGTITSIPDLILPLATLTTANPNIALSFTNSSTGAVNFLPDLITTPVGHPEEAVQLIPTLPAGDFGPSIFTGDGVVGDSLQVKAVTLNQPFNISMAHTDFNGCVTRADTQYLVYDHTTGLGISTQYCISPQYFPDLPTPIVYPTTYTVAFDAFPGFYLESLTTSPVTGTSFLAGLGNNPPISTLPIQLAPQNPPNNPYPGVKFYYSFDFDVTDIESGTAWPTASTYRQPVPLTSKFYYQGGTLGSVKFRGLYQSITNVALFGVPLEQNTEMFAPPLPYIEVSGNLQPTSGAPIVNPSGKGLMPALDPVTAGHPGTYLFCENSGLITFDGYPQASGSAPGTFALYDFSGPIPIPLAAPVGFIDQLNGTATLDPASFTTSQMPTSTRYKEILVTYTFKENGSPCQSIAKLVIQITPNPTPDFTYSFVGGPLNSACQDEPILFTDNSSNPSSIQGFPAFTVAAWAWSFGDLGSGALNTSVATAPSHTYTTSQLYGGVSLSTTSNIGCPSVVPATKTITVGQTPVVNFSYTGVSKNDVFAFNPAGSSVASGPPINDSFATFDWTFGDAMGTTSLLITDIVTHPYAAPGKYVVDLTITSTLGCRSSKSIVSPQPDSRTLIVLANKSATPLAAYEAHFEDNVGEGWVPWFASNASFPLDFSSVPPAPSWVHPGASPAIDRAVIKKDTDPLIQTDLKFWSTNSNNSVSGRYNAFERSALYSPALDISLLTAPMISFNSIVQMGLSDGVILEYSKDNKNITDPTKEWIILGTRIGEGVDWFADKGISAKPGAQVGNDFGWTGSNKPNWISPKHTLDTISTTPPGPITNVVLRFSLASVDDIPDFEGFGLDNVRIGDRTRTILLESFANTGNSSPAEKAVNDFVQIFPASIVGTKVVKINYHVNFPLDDPFNLDNPSDPSSRASFYGVTQTPKSRLDGSDDPSADATNLPRAFTDWGYALYGKRSLELAQADMTITPTVSAGKVSILVNVDARFDLPANTVLHVAILEDLISASSLSTNQQSLIKSGETGFNSVLKKLLPTASGTKFGTALLSTDPPKDFGPFEFFPSTLYPNTDDLTIVAFLQREDGDRQIYQVSFEDTFADPSVVTGLEPIPSDQIIVFPNPANREMTVQLPGQLTKPAVIQMIDQTGRVTLRSSIPEGADRKTLNVSELSGGVYIMTIDMGSGVLTRKKVMVVHQD